MIELCWRCCKLHCDMQLKPLTIHLECISDNIQFDRINVANILINLQQLKTNPTDSMRLSLILYANWCCRCDGAGSNFSNLQPDEACYRIQDNRSSSGDLEPCHKWIYDTSVFQSTIVSDVLTTLFHFFKDILVQWAGSKKNRAILIRWHYFRINIHYYFRSHLVPSALISCQHLSDRMGQQR